MESESTKLPRLLTVRELAAATGLPRWRIHELVAKGDAPPHLRIGRTIRFPEDEVAAWIRARTGAADAMERYES